MNKFTKLNISPLLRAYCSSGRVSTVSHNYSRSNYSKSYSTETPCRIGCASGFWGDTPTSVPQLVKKGDIDYLILDYLSEITMSLLTAAKAKNPAMGYCPDFVVSAVGPWLKVIKEKGVKVITNAGGINPESCAEAMRAAAKKQGVDLRIGVVTGDNLMPQLASLAGTPDMMTGMPLPKRVLSANAYTGAGPIMKALEMGADIVITGRAADSALALAPAAFHHGWQLSNLSAMAGGSLAGHLIECGAQATGGNFTDWHTVQGWHNMGFPIASVSADGSFILSKPPKTGGIISRAAACEQMLYEVGDPRAYLLPDVSLDMTGVSVETVGEERVEFRGAVGNPATDTYKVGCTYLDGYKATAVCMFGGNHAAIKARVTADATLDRVDAILKVMGEDSFPRAHVQVIGNEDSYGPHSLKPPSREAVLWLSVAHKNKAPLEVFARELAASGTGGVPGIMGLIGGRPKVTPVLRLHSSLIQKSAVQQRVTVEGDSVDYVEVEGGVSCDSYRKPEQPGSETEELTGDCTYRLGDLAYARSGDKGDSCNIAVVARDAKAWGILKDRVTSEAVAGYMAHVFGEEVEPRECVSRYEVPGIQGLNFLLTNSLGGGGVASLRADPQGKAYAQMLLDMPIQDCPDVSS